MFPQNVQLSRTWMAVGLMSLLTFFPTFSQAQVCQGNLGENIFTEGDFGEGTANILLPNPNIAPGYNYTTNPPPSDGQYVITNHTGAWANLYPSWLRIFDNSSSNQGYMMVVNASFSPGKFYEQTVTGLCENTLFEFSADVINLIGRNVANHIKPNVSFLIDDVVVFSTGDIDQDQIWHTYGFTFSTQPGQTSVKLSLQNNAPGGIGNDLAIDNIAFRACGPEARVGPETDIFVCEDGDPFVMQAILNGNQYPNPAFQWQRSPDGGLTWENIPGANGNTFTHTAQASGFYYYRYLVANENVNLSNAKCRILSNVKIVEVVPKFYTVFDTICTGLTYMTGNNAYTTTGVYVDTLTSSIGCDSIRTLHLNVVPQPNMGAEYDLQDPSCHDRTDGSIAVLSVSGGVGPYTYYFEGAGPFNEADFRDLAGGTYDLKIEDRYGCTLESQLELVAPIPFTLELGEDVQVRLGEELTLDPIANGPIGSYQWVPADLVDCDTAACLPVTWAPTISGWLRLDAFSETGCPASDSIFIRVIKVRSVFIPSGFTPNGDGRNERFTVTGPTPQIVRVQSLAVFNRWGQAVFQQDNFQPGAADSGWDGFMGSVAAPEGVYMYQARVEFLDGLVIPYAGTLTLIR
ncbi:MAG: gliding motility-associated C-terminal domain-containing protein [Bacteroidota bacterium]